MPDREDWRVEVDVEAHGLADKLLERVHERKVARDARRRLGDEVTISVDAHKLFAYAADEPAANEAASVLRELASEEGLDPTVTISRWHPEAERWEDPSVPLPVTPAERAAEHAEQQATERRESQEQGFPEWEVEVDLPSEEATDALAERLHREGLVVGKRRDRLVLGADTEDDAQALAERMRAEAPEATSVSVQGSEAVAWEQTHRFGWLGGLGG